MTFILVLGLASCGGSDDSQMAKLRTVNATGDLSSLSLTVDSDAIDEQANASALGANSASDYARLDSGTYLLRMRRAGGSAALASVSQELKKDKYYTALVHGREGKLAIQLLDEDQDEPADGQAKVRVFQSSFDAGDVDVFLSDGNTALDTETPLLAAMGASTLSEWVTVSNGTYRLRVTGKSNPADLRLDVPSLVVGSKDVLTVVVQPSAGGVLVHALVIPQQATPNAQRNLQSRIRLVAGAGDNAAVTGKVGDTSLNVNLRSPSVGSYRLVTAGSVPLTLTVNGNSTLGGTSTLGSGRDYTVMVTGTSASPEYRLLEDDNRLPTSSSKARMRLVHGAFDVQSSLSLALEYGSVASDVAYGTASSPALVEPSSSARVEVTSPLYVQPLYLNTEAVVSASGVYTLFVLGGASSPAGVLRRDR